MHPRSKQWHLLDYVICHRWDTHDVRITRAIWVSRVLELTTDCQILYCCCILSQSSSRSSNSFSLHSTLRSWRHIKYHEQFAASLDDKLTSHGHLTGNTTQKWDQFKVLVMGISRVNTWTEEESSSRLVQCKWWEASQISLKIGGKHIWHGRMTDHLHPNVTISNIFKTWHRLHSARCQDKCGERKAEEVEHFADTKTPKCSLVS